MTIGRKMLLVGAVLPLMAWAFVALSPNSDGLDWIRKYDAKEVVRRVDGAGGDNRMHTFYFHNGLPQKFLREFNERTSMRSLTTSTSGRFAEAATFHMNRFESTVTVSYRIAPSWLESKWIALAKTLGFNN